jgi:hypothetical protein
MNKGSAASSQLELLSQKEEKRLFPGEVEVKKACPTQPQIASVMAIQTPPLKRRNIKNKSNAPMAKVSKITP